MKFACVDRLAGICSHRCVKFSLPLILALTAITLSLNACSHGVTTLENRRDLYEPAKVEGPYNQQLTKQRVDNTVSKAPQPIKNH